MIDLSELVVAAVRAVEMVELFSQERMSERLRYEVARNSMMVTIFTVASEMPEKEGENFLGTWADKVSDFKSYREYKDYVQLHKERAADKCKFKQFEDHLEGLIIQFRRDSSDSPDAKN